MARTRTCVFPESGRVKALAVVLSAGLAAVALSGCSSPTRDSDSLAYPTYPAHSERGGDGALFTGTVHSDSGCLIVVSDSGDHFIPLYPSNDPRPADFRVGDFVGVGGGFSGGTTADLDSDHYEVPDACLGLPHSVIHVVQDYL